MNGKGKTFRLMFTTRMPAGVMAFLSVVSTQIVRELSFDSTLNYSSSRYSVVNKLRITDDP